MIASVLRPLTNALLAFGDAELAIDGLGADPLVDEVQRTILDLLEDLAEVQPRDSDRDDDESPDQQDQDREARPARIRGLREVLVHVVPGEHDARGSDREADVDDLAQDRGRLEEQAVEADADQL